MSVDLTALDAIIANLERADALVAKYSRLIADEAIRLAPYDPEADHLHLREDIIVHLDGMVAEITAGEHLPDERARAQEFGTSRMAAHPYFRPAMERYADAFAAELQTLLGG